LALDLEHATCLNLEADVEKVVVLLRHSCGWDLGLSSSPFSAAYHTTEPYYHYSHSHLHHHHHSREEAVAVAMVMGYPYNQAYTYHNCDCAPEPCQWMCHPYLPSQLCSWHPPSSSLYCAGGVGGGEPQFGSSSGSNSNVRHNHRGSSSSSSSAGPGLLSWHSSCFLIAHSHRKVMLPR
jgi:hypothetical protein